MFVRINTINCFLTLCHSIHFVSSDAMFKMIEIFCILTSIKQGAFFLQTDLHNYFVYTIYDADIFQTLC